MATGAAAAAGGVGSLATEAASGPSLRQDKKIFQFLLQLEYLQAAFYERALAANGVRGEFRRFAEVASGHETEHIAALERVLGSDARPTPTFHFGGSVTRQERFAAGALTLEETASAAYIGQGANLTAANMTIAARIVSVEARHAAWIRDLVGRLPAPHAADPAKTAEEAMATIDRTGFVEQS